MSRFRLCIFGVLAVLLVGVFGLRVVSAVDDRFVILEIEGEIEKGRWHARTLPNAIGEEGIPFELVGNPNLVLTPKQIVHVWGSLSQAAGARPVLTARKIDQDVAQSYATWIDRGPIDPSRPSLKGDRSFATTMEAVVVQEAPGGRWIVEDIATGQRYIAVYKYGDGTVLPVIGEVYTLQGSLPGGEEQGLPLFEVERDLAHANAEAH